MLRDRYDPQDLFTQIPNLCLQFEPVLAQLDRLLEDDDLFQRVKANLARRSPQTLSRGRPSTPVEVILRMLVVKRLYGWSYEETEHFVGDSLILRQFCRLYFERVPDDTVLIRWANVIGPATLTQLNDRIVALARELKVTRGRQLRVDSTVVPTNIHHPTDGALIADGVRVLSRLLRRAKSRIGAAGDWGKELFRDRTRSVRSLVRTIHRLARRQREAMPSAGRKRSRKASEGGLTVAERARSAMKEAYQQLIKVARQSQRQARRVCDGLRSHGDEAAQRLLKPLEEILPRIDQVVSQA